MGSQHKCQFPQTLCNNQTIQPSHKCTRCMVIKHEICVSEVVTQYTVCHFNNNQSAPDCPCGCMVPHFEDTDCVTVEKSGTLPVQQLRIFRPSVVNHNLWHPADGATSIISLDDHQLSLWLCGGTFWVPSQSAYSWILTSKYTSLKNHSDLAVLEPRKGDEPQTTANNISW